jgi:hypothetical protein
MLLIVKLIAVIPVTVIGMVMKIFWIDRFTLGKPSMSFPG